MESPGIYAIINSHTQQVYIGSSRTSVTRRWNEHKRDLRANKHHSPRLQNSWNKYGEQVFEFVAIEDATPDSVLEAEQLYIDLLNPFFNICRVAGNCAGRKWSAAQLLKMSIAGKKRGPNEHLIAQQQPKDPVPTETHRFCVPGNHWSIKADFRRGAHRICRQCYNSARPKRKTARGYKGWGREMGTKIVCSAPGLSVGFYSIRDAVLFFKSQHPKINKTSIKAAIANSSQYKGMSWSLAQ